MASLACPSPRRSWNVDFLRFDPLPHAPEITGAPEQVLIDEIGAPGRCPDVRLHFRTHRRSRRFHQRVVSVPNATLSDGDDTLFGQWLVVALRISLVASRYCLAQS